MVTALLKLESRGVGEGWSGALTLGINAFVAAD